MKLKIKISNLVGGCGMAYALTDRGLKKYFSYVYFDEDAHFGFLFFLRFRSTSKFK
ncbi:unnamed protein product [Amoebophrya sp. A25]|nr:unnamed protein product [Amoebophrya sp. A25]|eukprot:GSA25T00011242001.1